MYTNKQIFNDGIRFNGQVPADDRMYLDSLEQLYITTSTYTSSQLYGRAYKGLIVVIGQTNNVLVCKNAEPYTPGRITPSNPVNSATYLTYWKDITDKSKMVDGNSIKVVQDKFTGTLYKINKITNPPTGVYASYALAVKTPGASEYVNLIDSFQIDIPELQVVNDIHVCKAVYNQQTGKYVETARQGDPNWDTAPGDVYLHIIWKTVDEDSSDNTSETYIKVSDMISVDLTDLQRQIDETNANLNAYVNVETIHYNTLTNNINDVSSQLQSLGNYVNGNVTNRLDNIDIQIDDVSENLANNVNELQNNIDNTSTYFVNRIEKINSSIDDVNFNLNRKIDDVSNGLVYFINSSIVNVSSYVNDRVNDISLNLRNQITKENSDISAVNTHLSIIDASCSIITFDINSLNNRLISNVAELTDLYNSVIRDVSNQESIIAASYIKLKQDVNLDIESEFNDLSINVNRKINDLSANIEVNINRKINDLSNEIDETSTYLNDRISAVNTQVQTIQSYVNTEINRINSSMGSMKNDISTFERTVTTQINSLRNELQGEIGNISTNLETNVNNLQSQINNVSSNINTYVQNINNSIIDLSTNVYGKIDSVNSSLVNFINTSINNATVRLNNNIDTVERNLNDHMNASFAEAQSAYTEAADILNDVSTQEVAMAAALIMMKNVINTQHPNVFGFNGIDTLDSVSPVKKTIAIDRNNITDIQSVNNEEINYYQYVDSDVDMTSVFSAEIGSDASVDLRSINNTKYYLIKNGLKINVRFTFKENSDNVVFYYDFIDTTAFKREFIEIGMNDESSLVIINKKVVKLCKI